MNNVIFEPITKSVIGSFFFRKIFKVEVKGDIF